MSGNRRPRAEEGRDLAPADRHAVPLGLNRDGLAVECYEASPPDNCGAGSRLLVWRLTSRPVIERARGHQLVDRCRARLHLFGGRREADASYHPTADEPPLPGRRSMPGQHVTRSRMAPPPGNRSRQRIDSCAYATPDPIHPASRLSTDPLAPPWSADHDEHANRRQG